MSLSGTYQVKVRTKLGSLKGKLSIQTDGDTFSGTIETTSGVSDVTNGRVDGNRLSWRSKTKTPMGAYDVNYTAVIDGGKVSGEASMPMGTAPLEGKKV